MMGLFKLFSLKNKTKQNKEREFLIVVVFGLGQSNPIHISHPKYYTYTVDNRYKRKERIMFCCRLK